MMKNVEKKHISTHDFFKSGHQLPLACDRSRSERETCSIFVILIDPDDFRVKNHEFSVSVTISLFFSNYIVLIFCVIFLRHSDISMFFYILISQIHTCNDFLDCFYTCFFFNLFCMCFTRYTCIDHDFREIHVKTQDFKGHQFWAIYSHTENFRVRLCKNRATTSVYYIDHNTFGGYVRIQKRQSELYNRCG